MANVGTPRSTPTFKYAGADLRAVQLDGEPWFVAADACRILGIYQTTNGMTTKVRRQLAPDECQVTQLLAPHPRWEGKTALRPFLLISPERFCRASVVAKDIYCTFSKTPAQAFTEISSKLEAAASKNMALPRAKTFAARSAKQAGALAVTNS